VTLPSFPGSPAEGPEDLPGSARAPFRVGDVGKSKSGHTNGYQDILRLAERLLGPGSDFEETVEIEDLALSGDRARLTVRRTHAMTGWLGSKQRGMNRAVETWWKVTTCCAKMR
jgi:hypothetical protein